MFNLRSIRLSCGFTAENVAKHCGVSSSTIRKYEVKPSRLPLYLIIELSGLYEIPPSAFITST